MLSERRLDQLRKLVIARSKARVEQPGASQAFLVRAGVVLPDGRLADRYRPTPVRSIKKSKRTRLPHHLQRKQGQRTPLLAASGGMR